MRPRFHVPGVTAASASVELPEDEAEHLVRVLRLGVGDEVEVFDGRGGLWRAEVVQAAKKSAAIRALEPLPAARELGVQLTLVASVLKGDKMDDVVRDAVMLGVAAIQPVVSERAETSMAAMARSNRVARWQRIAVSSAKQCGRAVVPPIHPAMPLDWYWNERPRRVRVLCVEPAATLGDVYPVQSVAEAGRPARDRGARGRMDGDGSGCGPRFWRYPDVARLAHVARGRGADRGVDGVADDLG